MKKIILSLVMLISTASIAQTTPVQEPPKVVKDSAIVLKEGTIIKCQLEQDLNGKENSIGQTIDFTLSEDIIIDNKVVLPKGLKIVGTITEAAASKGLGKKGKLSFSINYIYLSDNRVFKLRNQVTKNLSGSGGIVAAGTVLLTPLALFIKGKNAKYKKGEVFQAFLDEDIPL